MAADKVTTEPHHHAVDASELPLVIEQREEPLLQLVEACVAHVERIVVQPVHGVGINSLLAVDIRKQHDHRRSVLR